MVIRGILLTVWLENSAGNSLPSLYYYGGVVIPSQIEQNNIDIAKTVELEIPAGRSGMTLYHLIPTGGYGSYYYNKLSDTDDVLDVN